MALPSRIIEWQPLRDAYIRRPQRPTYDELATEFSVSGAAIQRCSSEEGWPALRNAWLESQIKAADGAAVILAAVQGDRAVGQAYLSLAIVTLARLQMTVEAIPEERAATTKAEVINTCMFAAKNLADALRAVGIIGISKKFADEGKEANGRWDPKLLIQINQTVQSLQSKADAATAEVTQIVETPADTSNDLHNGQKEAKIG